MRKVFIIALGLASLGALATAQPAFAVKKHICQYASNLKAAFGDDKYPNQFKAQCFDGGQPYGDKWVKNNCSKSWSAVWGPTGPDTKICFDIDVPPTPTTPWQGSPAGYGKPLQVQKNIRAN